MLPELVSATMQPMFFFTPFALGCAQQKATPGGNEFGQNKKALQIAQFQ